MTRLDSILAEARAYVDKGLPDHFAAVRFARVLLAFDQGITDGAAIDGDLMAWYHAHVDHLLAGAPLAAEPPARDQLDLFGGGS